MTERAGRGLSLDPLSRRVTPIGGVTGLIQMHDPKRHDLIIGA